MKQQQKTPMIYPVFLFTFGVALGAVAATGAALATVPGLAYGAEIVCDESAGRTETPDPEIGSQGEQVCNVGTIYGAPVRVVFFE